MRLSRYREGRALGTGDCDDVTTGRETGTGGPPRKRCCFFLGELALPRKEVIQPHVPVRLPCYDFTPLTLHTFGASPHCWLGRRLRVQTTRVV